MNCVNNCLIMSNTVDTQEFALERLKNVLIIFEKKKRNLDKRKNKLDEYKKKKDLNEDQQMAVSKYQEVVSNLELVDELNALALQQIKDAEKTLKKFKKQEKLENKRHEASLIEFVMKTYYLLEKIFDNEKLQSKLLSENYIDISEINVLKELYFEIHKSDKGNWKKCSEQLQSLFEGGNKPMEINASDDSLLKSVSKDDILRFIEKIANIDWLLSNYSEEQFEKKVEVQVPEVEEEEEAEETNVCEELVEQAEELHQLNQPILIKDADNSIDKMPNQPENPKLNFVFLHESVVQEDGYTKTSENGYDSSGFNDDHIPRSNSQLSDRGEKAVDDVFSSATQSEFMHSENSRNLKTRGQRQASNGRFRTRGAPPAALFSNREAPPETTNYWKSNRGGSFNSNSRFPRSSPRSRGQGGRGRGNGRSDSNRVSVNDEMLTSMQ